MDDSANQPVIFMIDLQVTTEWVFINSYGGYMNGIEDFTLRYCDDHNAHYARFSAWLDVPRKIYGKIDNVFYEEGYKLLDAQGVQDYNRFRTILIAWCDKYSISCEDIPIGAVREYIQEIRTARNHSYDVHIEQNKT